MTADQNKKSGDQDSAALDRRQFVKVGVTSLSVAGLGDLRIRIPLSLAERAL
jgi:hypothetical protein